MNKASDVLEILSKVKAALQRRGSKTITGLGRTFRALDSYDGNKKVDSSEFNVGLRENGVELTQAESDVLLTYFDKDGDGCVNFDEFLVGIRGELNERRKDIVLKAFLKFDKDCSGAITADDLAGVYRVDMHPKFKSGEMTEVEIFNEFLANFGDKNKDGTVTKQEWLEYYAAVSSNIDNDDHFILLMRNAWQLD